MFSCPYEIDYSFCGGGGLFGDGGKSGEFCPRRSRRRKRNDDASRCGRAGDGIENEVGACARVHDENRETGGRA